MAVLMTGFLWAAFSKATNTKRPNPPARAFGIDASAERIKEVN